MPRDTYQTVKEVADRLKISEATVRGWIREGALRAVDIGKGWRIADTDLNAFLLRRATRARKADQEQGLEKEPEPGAAGKP